MFTKKRYVSSESFYEQNKDAFEEILGAKVKLKSMSELSQTGMALAAAEGLCFDFLNLKNKVSDLMFGLSASVNDAKVHYKELEGLFFRDSGVKTSAADKSKLVQAFPQYVEAHKNFNDLTDLLEFLQMKRADFDSAYYYYRDISTKKQ